MHGEAPGLTTNAPSVDEVPLNHLQQYPWHSLLPCRRVAYTQGAECNVPRWDYVSETVFGHQDNALYQPVYAEQSVGLTCGDAVRFWVRKGPRGNQQTQDRGS